MIVADTSSLISLEIIGALGKSLQITEIATPRAVERELKEMERHKDKEGRAAKNVLEMIKKKSIKILGIKNERKAEALLSKAVNRGEAECFVCCLENGVEILVMDDIDAAYSLEGLSIAHGIKIKISAAALVELYRQRIIDKKELEGLIKKLIQIREWEGGALEVLTRRYIENM